MAGIDPIAAFWSWWPSFVSVLRAAGTPAPLEQHEALVDRAHAIHAKVQVLGRYKPDQGSWLCLSSRGDLGVRATLDRWLELATADAGWRFMAARPRSWPPDRVPTPFPLSDLAAETRIDDTREVADVSLYHPGMEPLPPVHRTQLAFLALDHLLGEDDVERWIGTIEVSLEPIGKPIITLRQEVQALSARATGERWQVLRGDIGGAPFMVTINRAIKPLDHLALDIHARIDVQLRQPNERGLAGKTEALDLDALQDDLQRDLGTRSLVVARETHRGHRIVHLHVDPAAARDLDTWRHKQPERTISVLSQPDPSWDVLRRWG